MPKLLVMRGDTVEAEVELMRRDVRIGRSAENDLVLSDPTNAVSRHHAELRYEAGEYVLVDLNSRNGTWVDGTSIRRVELRHGASVLIGPYRLVLDSPFAASRDATSRGAAPSVGAGQTPGRPVEVRADAPVRRAARARVQTSAPAPEGAGPIAWLARQPKPLLFGGFVVFMGLLLLVLNLLSSSGPPPSPGKDGPTNDERVAALLSQGKALLDKGDAAGALAKFEQALIIKPDDPEALDLQTKAREQRRAPAAGSAGTSR